MMRRRRSSFGVVQQPDDDQFPESCNRQLELVAQKNPNTDTIQPTSKNTYFSSQAFFDHFKKSFYGLGDNPHPTSPSIRDWRSYFWFLFY